MRILFTIHHELDLGAGAPGITLRLAEAMRARGHEVATYSWDDLPRRLGSRGGELLFPMFTSRRIAAGGRQGLDIVDASTADAWPYLRLRGAAATPKVVVRSHGLEHTYVDARHEQHRLAGTTPSRIERVYHDRYRLWEVAQSIRLADAVVFGNDGDRNRAIRDLGVRSDRAVCLPNGLDASFIGLPSPETARTGPLRVAQVGSWDPRKGTAYAVEAARQLMERGAGIELSFLGTRVPAGVVTAALPGELPGAVTSVEQFPNDALPRLLRDFDVLLQPSLAEGFSLSLLEGMACGLAPVAFDSGAASELLAGGAGIVVPLGDATALAGALERLDRDRDLLERMRATAHRRAQDYSWQAAAEKTEALYERLLGGDR